ncbi:MAG: hypothetical protein NT051_03210, partial [Candidatus Micrarchaeota archaeon]|nr:hypothetical protein [Candidatus Micrarchaeota archaeon]
MTQLLSADAGGTRGRKNLPSAFHAIRPLEHVKVTNRMWRLLLDADLPHKANDKSDLVPRRKANGKSRSDLYRELSLDAMSDNARA